MNSLVEKICIAVVTELQQEMEKNWALFSSCPNVNTLLSLIDVKNIPVRRAMSNKGSNDGNDQNGVGRKKMTIGCTRLLESGVVCCKTSCDPERLRTIFDTKGTHHFVCASCQTTWSGRPTRNGKTTQKEWPPEYFAKPIWLGNGPAPDFDKLLSTVGKSVVLKPGPDKGTPPKEVNFAEVVPPEVMNMTNAATNGNVEQEPVEAAQDKPVEPTVDPVEPVEAVQDKPMPPKKERKKPAPKPKAQK